MACPQCPCSFTRSYRGGWDLAIRVLVVDDSALMRIMVSKMLEEDADIEVVGTARNGLDALTRIGKLDPDVVTMDIEMPELDGLSALKRIMNECPRPVIMLSSLTTAGADATVDALRHGAFDFLAKPGVRAGDLSGVAGELVAKVKLAARTSVRRLQGTPIQRTAGPPGLSRSAGTSQTRKVTQLVAIGTSTGGPRALDAVLSSLPKTMPCPILIVQHMPPKFTLSLARRLDGSCAIHVVEAQHHQVLENGTAYIAPGDFHMAVSGRDGQYRIILNQDPKRHEHRPSVDVLFESLALLPNIARHLVLMTGMGNDGAVGMMKAKKAGASTIAESEHTSVVYGMPKAAVELGCVDHIVPLPRIGQELLSLIQDTTQSSMKNGQSDI